MSLILGVSALYHDAAAALVENGCVVAAAEEERFSRIKHDDSLPHGVFSWLKEEHIRSREVDHVVFYERPLTKLDRIASAGRGTVAGFAASRRALSRFAREKLLVEARIAEALEAAEIRWNGRILYSDHHLSHAASAFYPSPFESAAVLCLDGVGEWASSSIHRGRGTVLDLVCEGSFPHSFGLFYATMTQLAGFKVNSGEYKLMGLAPYGQPRFVKTLKERVIDVRPDGSVVLDMAFFEYLHKDRMASDRLADLLWGGSLADPMTNDRGEPTELACDIAASAQVLCNEVLRGSALYALEHVGGRDLALAGGVALNSVAVGRLLEDGVVDAVFVQPAASDAGGALGCALQLAAQLDELDRSHAAEGVDAMRGSFLSYEVTPGEVDDVIRRYDLQTSMLDEDGMSMVVARLIESGHIVGVCRSRAEFGPRALGNRSILASAADPTTQTRLNLAVKQRESFRPFAPAILEEEAPEWFEYPYGDHFMTTVVRLRTDRRQDNPEAKGVFERVRQVRSALPAVTHLDHSARVQLVPAAHPLRPILVALRDLTGTSAVVNTSFNRRGEPIVRTAQDAFECFMRTDIDVLILGDHLISKKENTHACGLVEHITPEAD